MLVTEEIKQHIKKYFRLGYSYKLIHFLLESKHDCTISFSYLQRKLIPGMGLRRRGEVEDRMEDIVQHSMEEILNNGIAGSEQLRRTLSVKHNMRVPRKLSRTLVSVIDPEGVKMRKRHRLKRRQYMSKGPNYVWHMDGYDKLAPYGICIHGCIDGRKLIWLHAGITNRRPEVVASFFLQSVVEEGGLPAKVRADHGTENNYVATIQRAVYESNGAFVYGKSTANQRIERWWGYLRNSRSDFWRNELKILEGENHYVRGNNIHRLCLQYATMPFINRQLNEIKLLWNTHSIRQQKHGDCLPGIPVILHSENDLYGVQDYKKNITDAEMTMLIDLYKNDFLNMDQEFLELMAVIQETHNFLLPEDISTFHECIDLYKQLTAVIDNL